MKFSHLAAEWKATEGAALGQSTLQHYISALRAYVTPDFANRDIRTINRKAVQDCLTKQAEKYSRSSLRSLRLVMRMTLAWAERNGYIRQPSGWLDGIRLPKKVGGHKVVRTELKPGTDPCHRGAVEGAVLYDGSICGFARSIRQPSWAAPALGAKPQKG